jgi:hypothetical protein
MQLNEPDFIGGIDRLDELIDRLRQHLDADSPDDEVSRTLDEIDAASRALRQLAEPPQGDQQSPSA